MPELWQIHYKRGDAPLPDEARYSGALLAEPLLDHAQIFLWKQINQRTPRLAEYIFSNYQESLFSYKVSQKISESCYEFISVDEIDSKISEFVDNNLIKSLSEVSRRLAMTRMASPDTYLTNSHNENKESNKKELFEIIERIKKSFSSRSDFSEIKPELFRELVNEIRRMYEQYLTKYSVKGLLNLYRYEMLMVEEHLLMIIREAFKNLRRGNNPVMQEKICQSFTDNDWKHISKIEKILTYLKQIKENN